ncbi:MAG: GNAT family N-acetyltransferase [Chloroflexi bacterium]|nr:MAG: GNAT family N-acetyltransferase [Chloroflexota bacterium]
MATTVRNKLNRHVISAQALLFRNIVGGSFEVMPDWARGYSGLSLPIFNVFLPRVPSALTDDMLADTAAFFYSRNSLYAIEIVHDQIPEGPDFLHRRRYQALPPQPAMVLSSLPDALTVNPDVSIERVSTVPALTAFCSLQHDVFDFDLQDMRKRFPVAQLKENKIRHYLAFLDEQPVGSATIVFADNVASIWNLGTADSYRRQGVATSLMCSMLVEAQKQGCELTMLYATPHAYNLFNKFGFEIYTQRQWFLPQSIEYGDEADSL